MRHLSPHDLVNALEGAGSPRVTAHVAACAACRREVGDLAAVRSAAAGADVPEPPPLFWSQFATRVHDATQEAVVPRRRPPSFAWLGVRRAWPLAVAGIVLLAAAGSVLLTSGRRAPPESSQPVAESAAAAPGTATADDDAPWAIIAGVSADTDWDTALAALVEPAPGTVEHAVSQLSDAERAELARLLALELADFAL